MTARRRAPTIRVLTSLLILGLGLGIGLTCAFPARAQEGGTVAVSGTVVNGTPGGGVPSGAPVTLRLFEEDAGTSVYTSTVASEGTFRFEDLAPEVGMQFAVQVTYHGVPYLSEPAMLQAAGADGVEVRVYEVTEDDAEVRVAQAHLFLIPRDEAMQVAEIYSVSNTGDRTYIGSQAPDEVTSEDVRTTLRFNLPEEAERLTFRDGGFGSRYVGDARAFADTTPVPPGTTPVEIGFNYVLPNAAGMRIARTLEVPVQSALLILTGEGLALAGEGLTFNGDLDTQMGPSSTYLAGPLAAGETLAFSVVPEGEGATGGGADLPGADMGSGRTGAMEPLLGAGVLAAAGLVSWLLWRSAAVPPMPPDVRAEVTALARLDLVYENGEIPEGEYGARRAALKQGVKTRLSSTFHLDDGTEA